MLAKVPYTCTLLTKYLYTDIPSWQDYGDPGRVGAIFTSVVHRYNVYKAEWTS